MPDKKEGEVDVGHISHSLRKSKLRCDVQAYLNSIFPEGAGSRQISATLCYPERNVTGALAGEGVRYKQEDSLVGMGLAECRQVIVQGYPILMFHSTKAGLDIENRLKDYANDSMSILKRMEVIMKELEGKIWKKK
jgi:predicted transcriptional regulator with HTH domain